MGLKTTFTLIFLCIWNIANILCQTDGAVRLQDGSTSSQGRVEIYHNGEWRRVCEEGWGINDAKVVCRELGFEGALNYWINVDPRGTGPFWVSNLNCAGTEEALVNCTSLGWGVISSYCSTDHYDDAGVVCKTPDDGTVRLINTTSPYEGRVEVYFSGEWARICDFNWGSNDAKVVCRQLGFAGSHTSFRAWNPRGTGKYWIYNVNCGGSEENITQCTYSGFGSINSGYCNQNGYDDAGVICHGDGDGALRLINTTNAYEGRLEIFYSGRWGRVCDYGWDKTSADVACKQLGFSGVHTRLFRMSPRGTGDYWIQNLNCHGSEASLSECSHDGVGVITSSVCSSTSADDAGVLCKGPNDGEIRLIGDSQYFGRVEIFYAGAWGRVCRNGWSMNDAKVACRQLGFTGALNYWTNWTPRGTSRVLLDQLNCAGTESRLDGCSHGSPGWPNTYYCSATSNVDAGVACEAPDDGQLRLVDGNGYNSGRVEIKFAGLWRRVCDYYWGDNDAAVVCRQLGYSGYIRSARAWTPRGTSSFWISNVGCQGTETNLTDCTHAGVGAYNTLYCSQTYNDDAGVYCQGYLPGYVPPNTTTSTTSTTSTTISTSTTSSARGTRCYICQSSSSCSSVQMYSSQYFYTCSYGTVCHTTATAHRSFITYAISYSYSRGCISQSSCLSKEFQGTACKGSGTDKVCRKCCSSDLCNYEVLDVNNSGHRAFGSLTGYLEIFVGTLGLCMLDIRS